MSARRAGWLGLAALVGVLLCSAAAFAEPPDQAYRAALASLGKGADNEAIDRLELLADRGFSHPDASAARAAAYLSRAEGANARPGDLGRAAAALSEVLMLRPNDAQAEHALEVVQGEIARRKSRQADSVMVRPRLGRAIAALLPEQLWAVLALLGSVVLALGIVLRRSMTHGLPRLYGAVAIGVGAAVLLGFGAGTYAAYQYRVSSQPAVIVVPEGRLTNETGRPLPYKKGADSTIVPEGATVYVRERREGRCLVEWGNTDGWLNLSDVRLLGAP